MNSIFRFQFLVQQCENFCFLYVELFFSNTPGEFTTKIDAQLLLEEEVVFETEFSEEKEIKLKEIPLSFQKVQIIRGGSIGSIVPLLEILRPLEKFVQFAVHYLMIFLASVSLTATMIVPLCFLLNTSNDPKPFRVSNLLRYWGATSFSLMIYLSLEQLAIVTLPPVLFVPVQKVQLGKKVRTLVQGTKFMYSLAVAKDIMIPYRYPLALPSPYCYPWLLPYSLAQIAQFAFEKKRINVEMDPKKIQEAICLLHDHVIIPWLQNPTEKGLPFFLFFASRFPVYFPLRVK